MSAGKKILEEITRYKRINKYITEQGAPVPLPGEEETAGPPTDLGALVPEPAGDVGAPPVAPPAAPVTGETES
jgi:hypothetical protein